MSIQYVVLAGALFAGMTVAKADIIITQKTEGRASFVNLNGESTIKIKGNRQRNEQPVNGKPMASIIDVEGRRFITLDEKKNTAFITPLQALTESVREATTKPPVATVTKTSQQKTVASYPCTVHNVRISWPVNLSGDPDSPLEVTIVASGTACLSTAVPGYAEYRAFYATASDAGFIFGDPALAKTPTGAAQAKAFAALTRQMAEAGVSLESQMTASAEGNGPLASMLGALGNGAVRTTVTSVTTGDLPAEWFDVPPGYKVKTQK